MSQVSSVVSSRRTVSFREGLTTLVALVGDHDLASAAELRDVLSAAAESGLVVLDFARCTFVDSTVLGVISAAAKSRAQVGGRVLGVNARGLVRNALRLCQREELLLTDEDLLSDSTAWLDDERAALLRQLVAVRSAGA